MRDRSLQYCETSCSFVGQERDSRAPRAPASKKVEIETGPTGLQHLSKLDSLLAQTGSKKLV